MKSSPILFRGAADEVRFWVDFVHTDQFKTWLDDSQPTPELRGDVVKLIQGEKGRVLDVGSGVVSILRGTSKTILAADLLADEYKKFFDYEGHKIDPPIAVAAEHLLFSEGFQVVHMRNALDHSQNIFKAWDALRDAVRPGGILVVCGFENEGTHLHRLGMHQWDLTIIDNALTACHPGEERVPLPARNFFPLLHYVATLENGRNWVTWAGRKIK